MPAYVEADDRQGLERLLRYCARPAFALERLREIDAEHLVFESVKPGAGRSVSLVLTPLELIERLAALIPLPRRHRHRYYGVPAPNAPLRSAVTALAGAGAEPAQAGVEAPAAAVAVPAPIAPSASPALAEEPLHRRAARYAWTLLLAHVYEVFPLLCPKCGAKMRIIGFITDAPAVRQILAHLGEPTSPPRLAPGLAAHRCGRWLMPGRASSTPRPSQHRIRNSISASRGRWQRDELPCPSLGDSCLWAQDRPPASDLLPTGSDCGAIQAGSQELSARNPRLTSAATPLDTPQGAIEFPILYPHRSTRASPGNCSGSRGVDLPRNSWAPSRDARLRKGNAGKRGARLFAGRYLPEARGRRALTMLEPTPVGREAREAVCRSNNFDFIRLSAAVMVFVHHCWPLAGYPFTPILGYTGVAIFFIVSGYLIAQSWDQEPQLGPFLWKRFLRIYPALAVMTLIAVFAVGPLATTLPLSRYFSARETYQYLATASVFYLEHWQLPGVFLTNPVPLNVNVNVWTLPVEFRLYLVIAVLGMAGVLAMPRFLLVRGLLAVFAFVCLTLANVHFLSLLLRPALPAGDRHAPEPAGADHRRPPVVLPDLLLAGLGVLPVPRPTAV